jgi:hypothetical protein
MNPFELPGPQFLLLYIIFAGLVIAGLVFSRRRAELSPSTPRIDLSDPYLIAFLRGGEKEVARVASYASSSNGLNKPCESYDKTLRTARLLPDQYVTRGRLMRLVIAGLVLTGVGFAKVLIALEAGRTNVGFLVILIILAVVVASAISFPRLTESGKAMLEDVKSLYIGLKDRDGLSRQGGAAVEPMMLAAVFGVGALSTTGSADQLLLGRRKKSEGSCASDGDCGSSCSSSSANDSSSSSGSSVSSCSGGGGCGGGCGGCGG